MEFVSKRLSVVIKVMGKYVCQLRKTTYSYLQYYAVDYTAF